MAISILIVGAAALALTVVAIAVAIVRSVAFPAPRPSEHAVGESFRWVDVLPGESVTVRARSASGLHILVPGDEASVAIEKPMTAAE